jgi:outer membrane protein assembly factor BamB
MRFTPFAIVISALFAMPCSADDWPQWLGPNRDGQWKETGVLEKLPKEMKPIWTTKIGPGYTGPAVAQGKVILMDRVTNVPTAEGGQLTTSAGKERVVCLEASTGQEIWVHEYECAYKRISYGSGPRTTPIIAGEVIYTLGTMGDLKCLKLKDGEPIWQKSFPTDFKAPIPAWGWSANLLLDGDKLIALVGGDKQAVVAFDAKTGATKWTALTTNDICYSSPTIVEAGGQRQLLVWLSDYLASLNPDTGKEYWRHEHPAKGTELMRPAVSISMPKVAGDMVFISGGYHGALALKLGKDKPTAEIAWRAKNRVQQKPDTLSTLMTTILVHEGYLYGQCREGEMKCLKAETGEIVWADHTLLGGNPAQFGSASWVQNGDKVWCLTDTGDLVTLKLSPKGYEETSRTHLIDPTQGAGGRKVTWAHPAFAGKKIYARNDKQVICVSLAKQ